MDFWPSPRALSPDDATTTDLYSKNSLGGCKGEGK